MRRILVVDDIDSRALAHLLVVLNLGAPVRATSAAKAMALIDETGFDLILGDYILSGRRVVEGRWIVQPPSGLDVIRHARASKLNEDTPAILLSGAHDDIAINDAKDLKYNLLAKPFRSAQLLGAALPLIEPATTFEPHHRRWSQRFQLERREAEYFELSARGTPDEKCAVAMNLKPSMIAEHRKGIVRKVKSARHALGLWEPLHFDDVLNIFYREVLGLRE